MVRYRRDPAGRDITRSRRYLLWIVACLLMGRIASAQVMTPGNGAWATPFDGPQALSGPPPAFGPLGSEHELLPVNGSQEQGALQTINYNQSVGEYGSMNIYGSPDPDHYGAGAAFSVHPSGWLYLRDLQAAVYSNPEQTVVNAGSTFTLYTSDHFGIGGRALLGATVDDDLQDEIFFSGDAFAGLRLPGEIWLKGGFLYDMQDDFYKYGPTFGAVIMADAKHPITVDFAYGMGQGDIRLNQARTGFLGVADDDVQLRVGTYLSPAMQIGLSGNWARWDNDLFTDDSGIGGFTRMSIADLDITVDVTSGNLGTRGFVNVAYVFGGPNRRSWRHEDACPYVDRPQDWLTRPVIRDVSLRVQEAIVVTPGPVPPPVPPGPVPPPGTTPLVGNVTQVLCSVQVNPAFDQVNPGVVDPGDGFNMVVTLGNGTNVPAFNIAVTNITATSPFIVFNSPQTEVISYPNLLPNGGQASMLVPSASLGVDPSAPQGISFNVDFDVIADGAVRRFRCPVTLGVSGNATPASPAIPLN